jgi:hypothetical protein
LEVERQAIAYGIIALVAVIAIPLLARAWMRRRRESLRRRGIKRYGH